MNKAFLVGRLGNDATINDVNGKKVMNYSIGISTGTKDKPETTWWDCSQWGEKTAVVEYLKKGTQVAVVGEPGLRTYQRNDGTAGASMTLRVDKVELLGSRESKPVAANTGGGTNEGYNAEVIDDLPF